MSPNTRCRLKYILDIFKSAVILMELQHSFFKRRQRKTCHIYVWFCIKVDIVIWGHFYVTRGFLMLILGHRSHNCWSSEVVPSKGSRTCHRNLLLLLMSLTQVLSGERDRGGELLEPTHSPVPEIWFHVCWVWILKSGPVAIVPYSSDTVCTIWPMLDPPHSDPCICGKRTCEGIRRIYCLLLPALGKSRVQYSGTILFCRNINIK